MNARKRNAPIFVVGVLLFLTFPSAKGKLLAQDFEGFRTHFGLRVGPSANQLTYYADQTR